MTPKEALTHILLPHIHECPDCREAENTLWDLVSQPRTVAEIRAEIKRRRGVFSEMSASCMTGHEIARLSGAQEALIGILDFIDGKEG